MSAAFAALAKSADRLIDELNGMLDTGVNEIRLQGIRRDALKQAEQSHLAVDANSVLGMVAAMKGDRDGIDHHFGIAYRASQDPGVGYNHAIALGNIMHVEDGVRMLDEFMEKLPPAPSYFHQAAWVHADAGDIEGALRYTEKLRNLGVELDEVFLAKIDAARRRQALFERVGVSWHAYAERIKVIAERLRQEGQYIVRAIVESVNHEGALTEFIVEGSVERAAYLDSVIQDAIAEIPFSPLDCIVTFGCVPESA